jgi:ferrous iron transport protein B
MLGHFLHPLLAPIGFTWQMVVALIPGMAAREVAVAALGTVYAVGGDNQGTLAACWRTSGPSPRRWPFWPGMCSPPNACPPWPLSGARRQAGSGLALCFAYMLALAYIAAFIVFHVTLALAAEPPVAEGLRAALKTGAPACHPDRVASPSPRQKRT